MSKIINTLCDNCDSEYSLSFNENLVVEREQLICPFCGEKFDSIEEDIQEDFDLFVPEDSWD